MTSEIENSSVFTFYRLKWFVIYFLLLLGTYYVGIWGVVNWTGQGVSLAGECWHSKK